MGREGVERREEGEDETAENNDTPWKQKVIYHLIPHSACIPSHAGSMTPESLCEHVEKSYHHRAAGGAAADNVIVILRGRLPHLFGTGRQKLTAPGWNLPAFTQKKDS